jgi:phytoene synthase
MMLTSLAQSYTECERIARTQAANFYPAFRVLPKVQRQAMCALYAFLRITDDLVDLDSGQGSPQTNSENGHGLTRIDTDGEHPGTAREALCDWQRRLGLALEGNYSHAIHPALADTVTKFGIPRQYLNDVFTGVEIDLGPVAFESFDQLYRYCYCVASAVGLACIHIWGFEGEAAKVHAESAGIAFQLTNILRDLKEDAVRDHFYLPRQELEKFGYSALELRRGERTQSFVDLMRFEVDRARDYYRKAEDLKSHLSRPGRAVFQVLMRTYSSLLGQIEGRHYDVFSSRISLSRWKRVRVALSALPVRFGWSS